MNKLSISLVLVFGCYAQTPETPREFEVASIKPAGDPRQPGTSQHRFGPQIAGARADYFYMTLRQLIAEAYQVKPTQVSGPDWLTMDRFDVLTKMPAGSKREDAPAMLRTLLADRFKLSSHREAREEAVSALVVAPGGPRLKESSAGGEEPRPQRSGSEPSVSATMGSVTARVTVDVANSIAHFDARKAKMADLANFLQRFGVSNDRPVVDSTGLTGEYDFALDVPLAVFSQNSVSHAGASVESRPAEEAADPSSGRILRSLKDLGLELKKTKAAVEYLIVDRAERKPTEN